jgi:hypothetical protein
MQIAPSLLHGVHSAPRSAFLRRRSEISLDSRAICAVVTEIRRRSGENRRSTRASHEIRWPIRCLRANLADASRTRRAIVEKAQARGKFHWPE